MISVVRWIVLSVTTLSTLCGCSDGNVPTYPAGGKVTFSNGSPLDGGWVEYRPVTGEVNIARGPIQSDGTFELGTFVSKDGAVAGEHHVLVVPPPPAELSPGYIHPRFRQHKTSELKFVVTEDPKQNHYHIQVERGPSWGQAPSWK